MNTPALDMLGSMNSVEDTKFRQDIATGKAMGMGVNPDLVAEQVSVRRYG